MQSKGLLTELLSKFDLDKHALMYIFSANMVASFVTLLMMLGEFKNFKFRLPKTLWKQMLIFALPLVIVGLGGMINELFDRLMLPKLLSGTLEENKIQAGIYVQNFKLAALIIIFIQAFRMGGEPFFMRQSNDRDAGVTYARVLNFFFIICFQNRFFKIVFHNRYTISASNTCFSLFFALKIVFYFGSFIISAAFRNFWSADSSP